MHPVRSIYSVSEAHSELSQTSDTELFTTIVNGWKLWLGWECVSVLWWAHYIAFYFLLMGRISNTPEWDFKDWYYTEVACSYCYQSCARFLGTAYDLKSYILNWVFKLNPLRAKLFIWLNNANVKQKKKHQSQSRF